MNKLIKKVLFLFCFVGGYILLEQIIDLQTKGFCLQKILENDLPPQPQWETPPLSDREMDDVDHLLRQSFQLIGSGSECFVFLSEDKKTVIKFFKISFARPVYYNKGLLAEDHRDCAGILSSLPMRQKKWIEPFETYRKKIHGIREFRLIRTFSSCKLAYENLKEETGIFYLHINPTDHFHRLLTLIDGNGIQHKIDLDSAKFMLQKKATPLETHFKQLIQEKRYSDAQKSIDSLFDLIMNRCQKGFADRDFINRNLGYIGNKAIEIDVGSFTPDPNMKNPDIYTQEIILTTLEFKQWLIKNGPELIPYFDKVLRGANVIL